jgi:hypothetical protein
MSPATETRNDLDESKPGFDQTDVDFARLMRQWHPDRNFRGPKEQEITASPAVSDAKPVAPRSPKMTLLRPVIIGVPKWRNGVSWWPCLMIAAGKGEV